MPSSSLGKHFVSPKKCWTRQAIAKLGKNHEAFPYKGRQYKTLSQDSTPLAPVGEQLHTNYQLRTWFANGKQGGRRSTCNA